MIVPRRLRRDAAVLERHLQHRRPRRAGRSSRGRSPPTASGSRGPAAAPRPCAARSRPRRPSASQRAGVEVDADGVAGRSQASPPPAALSGEALRIEGLSDVPDWRPSPSVGRLVMPRRISASGGCMLTTSAEPGQPIGPAPRITRMQSSSMLERGVVDPVVVVVRAVEHDRAGLEHAFAARLAEVAVRGTPSEITLVFMIAKSNRLPCSTRKPARSLQRLRRRAGSSRGRWLSRPATFSARVRPVTVRQLAVELARLQQLPHHRRHAAGAVEALAEILARPAAC